MKITRLYSGSDGESHFAELELPLVDSGEIGALSEKLGATGIVFRCTGGDYDYDWYPAPARQFVIMLDGGVDIEVGSGEVRRIGPGEVLLAEDVTGRGHRSRAVDGRPRHSIFVTIPDGVVFGGESV